MSDTSACTAFKYFNSLISYFYLCLNISAGSFCICACSCILYVSFVFPWTLCICILHFKRLRHRGNAFTYFNRLGCCSTSFSPKPSLTVQKSKWGGSEGEVRCETRRHSFHSRKSQFLFIQKSLIFFSICQHTKDIAGQSRQLAAKSLLNIDLPCM